VSAQRIRLGVAGLGRAFTLMLPTFAADERIVLAAGADPRPEARDKFAADFGARTYADVDALCADPGIDAVYVATPHEHHAHHAIAAAAHGKHVLVEKPMALTVEECSAMIEAARASHVHIVVGPSHSFDAPIARTRALVEAGTYGRLRMITAVNYTDFLYRPRRPEELVTRQGGGVVYSQAAHHVDIVRLLAGGRAKSVRAVTGAWDLSRGTEGAYTALLTFEEGACATLCYSGYGRFDSDEFTGWIGELGREKSPEAYGHARRALPPGAAQEAAAKSARNYGGSDYRAPAPASWHEHFGLLIVSCERADLRPMPSSVLVYADDERRVENLPAPAIPRVEVIDELHAAVFGHTPPVHDGAWGRATLEVCTAMLRSAREGHDIELQHQVGLQ
jgi:phthalate 4,5-cis-dihydrodiol dehydrogenase